jgi:hypothetical protein
MQYQGGCGYGYDGYGLAGGAFSADDAIQLYRAGKIGVRPTGKMINNELRRNGFTTENKYAYFNDLRSDGLGVLADYMENKLATAVDNLIPIAKLTDQERAAGKGKFGPNGQPKRTGNTLPLKTVTIKGVKYRVRLDTRGMADVGAPKRQRRRRPMPEAQLAPLPEFTPATGQGMRRRRKSMQY